MSSQTHGQCVVFTPQPARCRRSRRHQVSDCLIIIILQFRLLSPGESLQIARDLMVARRNEYESFALRAPLEFKYALHCFAIRGIAAEAVAGFGGVRNDAAALKVGFEVASGDEGIRQTLLSDLSPSPQPLSRPRERGAR